jgi:zinc transport system ATP-binding protein
VSASTPGPVLELRDAVIGYDGHAVVTEVSFSVAAGEVVAVLGANGSGTSTLVRGILGLAEHLGGGIEAFGAPVERMGRRWRIGYVPQRHTLAVGIPATVTEIVTAGRLAQTPPWRRLGATDRQRVQSAIELVGLGGRERDPVSELSGGQQRRVLIARALAGDAELLLLDEPTAGVVAQNQVALADTMQHLVDDGVTILLVAHELGPAADVVTRSIVLHAGRITYDGLPLEGHLHDHGTDHHHLDDHDDPGPPGRLGILR